jgi:3-oxoacyl-[acyl-carrier-protein] synthase I
VTLAVIGSGMVTSVGYDAPASCAAIRCALNRFEETQFKLGGEWVVAASIPLPDEPRGVDRQLTLASMVIDECLAQLPPGAAGDTAWVVCLSEPERPGRARDLDKVFATQLRTC